MARIRVPEEEGEKILRLDEVRPTRYIVVTDGVSTLVLVPRKTSRHLHYYEIVYTDEKRLSEARMELEKRGFTVVVGEVSFLPG